MKIKHLLIGMLAMAATVACNQEEPVVTPELDLNKTTASVGAEGGSVALEVTSNVDWTASADQDWVSVDPASGKGSKDAAKVTVSVEPNESEEARTATVTVAAEKLTKTLKITQAGAASEEPDPEPEPEPEPEVAWSLMGCFVDNQWASDVPMTKEGEWIVAKGAQFTELTFKIRGNASWDDATNIGYAPGTEKGLVNAKLSVVTAEYSKANLGGDAADIKLNGVAGTYDVYFSFEKLEVYVMEEGYKPGEREPVPAEPKDVTYTVTGTIADHAWENNYAGGLMVAEGDYFVAKNVPFVWNSTLYGGDFNVIELKIVETGTWDAYAYPEKDVMQQVNTEVSLIIGGENVAFAAPEGTYDVYFDKANAKLWVMNAGYKPGETPEPEVELLATGDYWIMTDGRVATPLTTSYGYLQTVDAVDGKSTASNGFKFTLVDAAQSPDPEYVLYTIQDSKGKYLYQKAEYQSFNVGELDPASDAYYWEIYPMGDGTYYIANFDTMSTIQFDSAYNSYGCYAEERGAYPALVLVEDPIAEPEVPADPVVATVAEFLAAAEDATIYQLTGVITSVANTTYGNFYLKDETGEVYIYGLCSPEGEPKYWEASGAKVGDTITIQTARTSYNGTPQGKNAIFVSLVAAEPEPEPSLLHTEWLFSADAMTAYADNFGGTAGVADKNAGDGGKYVAANVAGEGKISYVQVDKNEIDIEGKATRIVGSSGHPYVTGIWPGDYWLFEATDGTEYAAGTKVSISYITRTSKTGHKYWRLEYLDGADWKPAMETQSYTLNEQEFNYNIAMFDDGKKNVEVNATVTLSAATKNVKFRMLCVANGQSSNEAFVEAPNGGTCRIAGAAGTSPVIKVVE